MRHGERRRRCGPAGGILLLAAGLAAATPDSPDFVPPAPGSYTLQRIQPAADGRVLDRAGKAGRLSAYTRGHITLLAFIYTHCADPDGCPRAFAVLHRVRNAFAAEPSTHRRLRLVSLSFDPERDTPARLRDYAGDHAADAAGHAPGVRWDFLTSASVRELQPILDGFGQDVLAVRDTAGGPPGGRFSHVPKVFLIDAGGMVREIYASDYLVAEMLINDVRTLLLEAGVRQP